MGTVNPHAFNNFFKNKWKEDKVVVTRCFPFRNRDPLLRVVKLRLKNFYSRGVKIFDEFFKACISHDFTTHFVSIIPLFVLYLAKTNFYFIFLSTNVLSVLV